jgi:ribosome-binding protein aMBF1 (putative translation factor)
MNKQLKILMIEKGVKNFDLAKRLKVDPAKVSKIVNGWIVPDGKLQKQIAQVLEVAVNEIWSE